jgi:integrase
MTHSHRGVDDVATLRRRGATYYVRWTDSNGVKHERSVGRDKRVAEQAKSRIEGELDRERAGLLNMQDRTLRDHEAQPLFDHLADWHRDMLARGKTAKHADQYRERAGKLAAVLAGTALSDLEPGRKVEALELAAITLVTVLKSARLSDLKPDRLQGVLAVLRDSGKSHQTVNHYRAAIRAFVRWAADKGRITANPMRGVTGFNVEEDPRHVRRSLTDDELARLIQAAQNGPMVFDMPGPLRAMAYRVATATGFRVSELRSLTPESFRLSDASPSIHLKASGTKNRKAADQPITSALARDLADWIAGIRPKESVFPLHHETAKAIRQDLEAAGISYETDAGIADFHSLRAYFVSAVVRSGASVKTVQTLARHAKPDTTLKHYAKVDLHDLRGALELIPSPTTPRRPNTTVETDTERKQISDRVPHYSPTFGDAEGHEMTHFDGPAGVGKTMISSEDVTQPLNTDGVWRSQAGTDGNRAERGGFEPPRPLSEPNGLANRQAIDVSSSPNGYLGHIRQRLPTDCPTDRRRTDKLHRRVGAIPSDLAIVIDRWADLPAPLRAGIVAMIDAATGRRPDSADTS